MEISIKNKDWLNVNLLFFKYKIGIQIKLLYCFPKKTNFNSLECIKEDEILYSNNMYLSELLNSLKKCKLTVLNEWNNSYGYRFL